MRGERPFIYHTPNSREMFQALQKFFARPTDGCGKPLCRGRRPAVERSGTNALGVRRPVCRGGRLCPPKTRAPCRAGPAYPAGENVSFAAGHMGPALQVISQGAMPTSPRRHLARRSRLGERKRRLLPLPLSALRAATSLAEGGKGRTDCRVASLLAMTALRAVWCAVLDVPSVGADDSVRPRLARPVGRGPRTPPERMCLLRRDTWVPPYKSFRRGRCPHRPARIALPANALGVDVPQKKEAPSRVLPLHILNASAACRSACSAMCPGSGTAAPAGSE